MAQRQTMYIAPATYLLIGFSIPAGAVIYVIAGSLFTIVQQHFINRQFTPILGMSAALKEGKIEHPENQDRSEHVKQVVEQNESKGVKVTVRRKK